MELPIENFDLKRRKELLTKYEKGIVMSCIDCNITKKHALETMRIKYPRIFSIVINDWDYYYKEYNTVKINEDEDEVELYDWIDVKVEVSRAAKVEKRPAAQKKGSKGLMVSNKEAVREWDLLYGRTHEHNGLPKVDKKKK